MGRRSAIVRSDIRQDPEGPSRLRDHGVRELPHRVWHGRPRHVRSRSHAPHEPGHYCGRRRAADSGQPSALDQKSRQRQTRIEDAGDATHTRRARRDHRVPADARVAPMTSLTDWVVTVDHKRLGMMYVMYGVMFLVIAGLEATAMRIQLAVPNNHFVSPQVFNQLFTMHGTTMIFFVAMPVVFGFGNYLIPLMIGARDMAYPRLNAFSFWITAFGGLLLYFSFLGGDGLYGAGNAPDVGWFAYAPLTSQTFSPGHSTDFWTLSLLISGVGSIGTAINIIATVLCMRCPGMTLGKIPLLAWLNLTMAGLVILAVSPLTAAQAMLMIDRYLGGHFFDTQAGGSAVMWMHFFWIFGHPEVYVLILPAFGFVSEIIPVFSRKPIFGYPVMVAATVSIGFVSMSVWAHHMFTVGMNSYANSFFAITTMAVGVPTGIKIFNWLGTIWGGKIQFKVPM